MYQERFGYTDEEMDEVPADKVGYWLAVEEQRHKREQRH